MFYVEWLRVRNCLRILGIILACCFLIAVVFRIVAAIEMNTYYAWIAHEEHKPGAHVVTTHLADGTTRTTIDDRADDVHIVIDDHGWLRKNITITGNGIENSGDSNVQIGTLGIHSLHGSSSGHSVQIDTNVGIPADVLLFFASWAAVIVGTVLAGPLAKENGNHLEISWTKPISRERLALGLFGVDAIGMLASMAMTILCMLLCIALFQLPIITASAQTPAILVLCVLVPFAWYDLLTVCSASLKRGRGAVLGLGWFVALVLPGVALGMSAIDVQPFHAIGVVLGYLTMLDPLAYMHANLGDAGTSGVVGYSFGLLSAGPAIRDVALAVLCIVYCTLSLVQWRRLEA